MASIIILNSNFFLGLYTDSEESLQAGQQVMFTVLPLYFLCGLNEVSCAELRSLKHPLIPTIISITFICGFRILWIYTYFAKHKTIEVLYMSYIISWTLAWLIHFCLYYFLRNKSYEKRSSYEKYTFTDNKYNYYSESYNVGGEYMNTSVQRHNATFGDEPNNSNIDLNPYISFGV